MSMMCRPKWPFLHMYGSHDMRHVDFRGLTGSQRTPRVWGVTSAGSAEVNSMTKSVKTCPFIAVFGLYLMSNSLNSMAHFISLPEVSGLCSTCFIGYSIGTSMV